MSVTQFHRLLRPKLEEVVRDRKEQLGAGRVSAPDAATLAMNYNRAVGYIEGMTDALKLIDETDEEMNT